MPEVSAQPKPPTFETIEYLRSVITEMAKDPSMAPELTPRKWLERKRAAEAATSENAAPATVG